MKTEKLATRTRSDKGNLIVLASSQIIDSMNVLAEVVSQS